jgi:IclR family mhp operon transcriptional activator
VLVRSAFGKAVLAASTLALCREVLNLTSSAVAEDAELGKDRRFVDETGRDGYASSAGWSEASISAIALAIAGGGPVLGSLNLIFFLSMTPERAARKYLSSMKEAVKEIERRWSAANKSGGQPSQLDGRE